MCGYVRRLSRVRNALWKQPESVLDEDGKLVLDRHDDPRSPRAELLKEGLRTR